jgi:hypothetical protein
MIIFENDLTKYINDTEWYDMKFLCMNLKGWIKHLEVYEKRNYKRAEKIKEKEKQIKLASEQINKINILINLL